ncbi:MAG: NPCBM/NEW2 domain-containing protein, partial [Lachnospiraceae bacterium]|nr:NPCBM/NEW2 domain-containing protein [Lachnospiraceae bacterium]
LSTGTLRPSDAERAHGLRLSGRELPAPAHASAEFARIIGRAVRFRPEERWQNARQMKDALEELKLQRRQAKAEAGRTERTAHYDSEDDVTEMLTYVSAESGKTGNPMSGYRMPGNQPATNQMSGYQVPGNQPATNQMSGYQIPGNQDRTSPMSGYQNPGGQNTQSRDPQGRSSQGYYEPQPGEPGSGTGRNDSLQTPYIPPAQLRTHGGTGRRQRKGEDTRGEDSTQSGKTRGTLVAALLGAAFGLLIILAVVFVFRDRVGTLLRGESGTASSQAESSAKGEKKDDAKGESSGKKSESASTDSKSADANSESAGTDSKPDGTGSTSSGESTEAGEQFISLKKIGKVNPEVTPTSLVYLDSARDNFGTTYKSAIAGGTSEMENADEYILDGKYRTIAGRVVMNYDTRANVGKDTYVRIYGDGNLLWESGRVTRGFVPQDFQVDITGVNRMKLTIQGCNFIRLVDCVISEEEKITGNSTAEGIIDNIVSGDHAEIIDLDWYSSSMQLSPSEGGLVFYGSAVDNNGTVYNSTAFGGRASYTENWNSYKISGAYSSITGKVILNNAYSDVVSENTQFRIYADGEVVYESQSVTAGRGPQEFSVSLEGVEDLRLGVVGANYMRVVDCTLNK